MERSFILSVPRAYRADRLHPLVMAFHGRTNSNRKARGYFALERHASRPTLFVYPSGVKHGRSYSWSGPRDAPGRIRDFELFDRIVERLGRSYCLDLDRIYVVGHSLGAWFANSLACARGHRIRAVASIAGGISAGPCRGRVAAMIAHNPRDRLARFARGKATRDHLLQQAGLSGETAAAPAGLLSCRRYGPEGGVHPLYWCPHRNDVTWRGKYYPHQWPRGSGKQFMAFFESLPDVPER